MLLTPASLMGQPPFLALLRRPDHSRDPLTFPQDRGQTQGHFAELRARLRVPSDDGSVAVPGDDHVARLKDVRRRVPRVKTRAQSLRQCHGRGPDPRGVRREDVMAETFRVSARNQRCPIRRRRGERFRARNDVRGVRANGRRTRQTLRPRVASCCLIGPHQKRGSEPVKTIREPALRTPVSERTITRDRYREKQA